MFQLWVPVSFSEKYIFIDDVELTVIERWKYTYLEHV